MTMYYKVAIFWGVFINFDENLMIRSIYRGLLTGLDLPRSGILFFLFHFCMFSKCRNTGQSGTGMKKITMPEPVWNQSKLMQSVIFLIRYLTEIMDAGIPMLLLVYSMLVRSYGLFALYANLKNTLHNKQNKWCVCVCMCVRAITSPYRTRMPDSFLQHPVLHLQT